MGSLLDAKNNVLPNHSSSSLGGNAAAYQSKMSGGHGYGFEGKEIAPGRMEFSSYKGGSNKRKSKRNKSKKNQRKQRKSRRR